MNFDVISIASFDVEDPACSRFILYAQNIRPILEERSLELEAMYAPVFGRPELSPALMTGITLLQMMEKKADREAVNLCRYDLRWRYALGITDAELKINASSLSQFRKRLANYDKARLVLDAALDAMRRSGYLRKNSAIRIDSTHVLGCLAALSRLENARETLRLALDFLQEFGGPVFWEPWIRNYIEGTLELKSGKLEKSQLERRVLLTGKDMRDVLAQADTLGPFVAKAHPVALLRRVFSENYIIAESGCLSQTEAQPSGAVQNPHEPEAQWSTKMSLSKEGWIGYKTQICETVPEARCEKGEPTTSVITAVVTQPAITSDHGSLLPVIAAHVHNGQEMPGTAYVDAGYISGPELAKAEKSGLELCGPSPAPPHSGGSRFGTDAFSINLSTRIAVCPAEKNSSSCSKITESLDHRAYYYFEWAESDCVVCPLREQCISQKKKRARRSIQVGEFHEYSQTRRELCKTKEYQIRMNQRSAIEGTNSELKRGYGLNRSRYRGHKRTDIQMQYTAAACNLRRWANRLCWLARKNP